MWAFRPGSLASHCRGYKSSGLKLSSSRMSDTCHFLTDRITEQIASLCLTSIRQTQLWSVLRDGGTFLLIRARATFLSSAQKRQNGMMNRKESRLGYVKVMSKEYLLCSPSSLWFHGDFPPPYCFPWKGFYKGLHVSLNFVLAADVGERAMLDWQLERFKSSGYAHNRESTNTNQERGERPLKLFGGCHCGLAFPCPLRSDGGKPLGFFPDSKRGPWAKLAAQEAGPACSLNWQIVRGMGQATPSLHYSHFLVRSPTSPPYFADMLLCWTLLWHS